MLYLTVVLLAATCCALAKPTPKDRDVLVSEKGDVNVTVGRDSLPDLPDDVSEDVIKNIKEIFGDLLNDKTSPTLKTTTDFKIFFDDKGIYDKSSSPNSNDISNEIFEFPKEIDWQIYDTKNKKFDQNDGSSYKIVMPDDYVSEIESLPSTEATSTPAGRLNGCQMYCHRKITSEYNPVCGSDGVTYTNTGKLNCAQLCGRKVRKIGHFTCGHFSPVV